MKMSLLTRLLTRVAPVLLAFAGCSTIPPDAGRSDSASFSGRAAEAAPAPARRPGLGTEFGEERPSSVRYAGFERADRDRPLATTAVYYDDAAGARAQSAALGGSRGEFSAPPRAARGLIELTVRDGASGFALKTVEAGGRRFVVGEPGRRYTVELHNRTDARLEVVLSVDGLDVIDGRPAAYRKPGYVVPPRGRTLVEGFRTNLGAVAAFRFGRVENSYAAQSGRSTRNVGVIGAAVFGERGRLPGGFDDAELRLRRGADPFPDRGQFAERPRSY